MRLIDFARSKLVMNTHYGHAPRLGACSVPVNDCPPASCTRSDLSLLNGHSTVQRSTPFVIVPSEILTLPEDLAVRSVSRTPDGKT